MDGSGGGDDSPAGRGDARAAVAAVSQVLMRGRFNCGPGGQGRRDPIGMGISSQRHAPGGRRSRERARPLDEPFRRRTAPGSSDRGTVVTASARIRRQLIARWAAPLVADCSASTMVRPARFRSHDAWRFSAHLALWGQRISTRRTTTWTTRPGTGEASAEKPAHEPHVPPSQALLACPTHGPAAGAAVSVYVSSARTLVWASRLQDAARSRWPRLRSSSA
jgi:hypothetical protein